MVFTHTFKTSALTQASPQICIEFIATITTTCVVAFHIGTCMRATAIIFSTLIDIYEEYIQLASTRLLHLAFTEHVKNGVVNSLTCTIHKIWTKCIPRRTATFKGAIFISTCVSTTTIITSTFINIYWLTYISVTRKCLMGCLLLLTIACLLILSQCISISTGAHGNT